MAKKPKEDTKPPSEQVSIRENHEDTKSTIPVGGVDNQRPDPDESSEPLRPEEIEAYRRSNIFNCYNVWYR